MKEDLFDHYNIYVIPRIIKELQIKLYDSFSIDPILIDFNDIILYNAKSPPKSEKLYAPISIDSNDSQFNMWNDCDWYIDNIDDKSVFSLVHLVYLTS